MKREARNHSKMKRLCRKLDIPIYQGVGLLESIWHLAATEAWRGDIGKLSNEDIALAIDYRGDEDKLIDALVSSGWLDLDGTHRLLVHDWPEHADQAVQKRAERSRRLGHGGFCLDMSGHLQTNAPNGSLPVPGPVPEPEPGAGAVADAPLSPPPPHDFDADPAENIPDGLSPVQYAVFVLQEVGVAASHALKVKTGDALELLARDEGCGLAVATRRMLDRMRDAARASPPPKWFFWLEDGCWKAPATAGVSTEGWE